MPHLHISLVAEEIFKLGGIVPVTNSLLTAWIVMAILIIFSFFATRKLSLVPGGLQSIAEILIDGFYNLFETVVHEKVSQFFPLLMTLFIFIIGINWTELLPGVGTIGITKESGRLFVPLFRPSTADLNLTLALALISVLVIQYTGLKTLGSRYLKKFFNFSNPINFFVGVLELISELSKIISFSFRLFGNIFAGDVLLTVVAFLIPLFAPLPFLGMELFVGFIQALVFSMLTAAFLSLATSSEH